MCRTFRCEASFWKSCVTFVVAMEACTTKWSSARLGPSRLYCTPWWMLGSSFSPCFGLVRFCLTAKKPWRAESWFLRSVACLSALCYVEGLYGSNCWSLLRFVLTFWVEIRCLRKWALTFICCIPTSQGLQSLCAVFFCLRGMCCALPSVGCRLCERFMYRWL